MRRRQDLAGRVVLLTGATGGLGPAIAHSLDRKGARVVLTSRSAPQLEQLLQQLEPRGHAVLTADLTDAADRADLIARTEDEVGPIDVVIHNAAIDACSSLERLSLAEIGEVVEVNLTAPMDIVRHTLPAMLQRGSGHHVFVSSLSGYSGTAFQAPYAATKAALLGLARSLRAEHIASPVSFSVVAPGSVGGAGMFGRGQDDGIEVPRSMRLTTPNAVAAAVLAAVELNRPEVIVYPSPIRPLLTLGLFAPSSFDRLQERLGIGRLFEPAARARGDHRAPF